MQTNDFVIPAQFPPARIGANLSFPSPACGRGAGERAGRRSVSAPFIEAASGLTAGPLPGPLQQVGEGEKPREHVRN